MRIHLKILPFLLCLTIGLGLSGCGKPQDKSAKIKDLEFTILGEDNIPPELAGLIQEKKSNSFKLTFQDNGFLYICRGYGEQKTGGYSISVNQVYLAENGIYVDSVLMGPQPGKITKRDQTSSYPYVVVKTEYIDKPVIFD